MDQRNELYEAVYGQLIRPGTRRYFLKCVDDATSSMSSIREFALEEGRGVVFVWLGLRWWAVPFRWFICRRLHTVLKQSLMAGVNLKIVTSMRDAAVRKVKR